VTRKRFFVVVALLSLVSVSFHAQSKHMHVGAEYAPHSEGKHFAALPTNVFVRAGQPEDRFIDRLLKESASDLSEYLSKGKDTRLVSSEQEAQVEIRVVRRFRNNPGGGVGVTGQNMGTLPPAQAYNVVAILIMRDSHLQLTGRHESVTAHDSMWRAAARDLANQIERWIVENRSRLLEH
jgi:hypothetical protein